MKLDTNLYQGKPPSLEEGPMKYYNSKEYNVLNRIERKKNCGRFIQILKVILYIELIIFIGWLGCVSLSKYNGDQEYIENKPCKKSGCEPSAVGCSVSDVNNESNAENIGIENRRGTRSISDIELAHQRCERSMIAMRERVDSLSTQVVIGKTSDPAVVKLRQKFIQMIISLTLRVIFVQSNDTLKATGPTDEEWRSFAVEIKQALVNSTDSEHRHQLEARGPLSQEITDEIRNTVESMARDYMNCETILPTPKLGNSKGTTQQALRLVEIVLEREKCGNSFNTTQERLRELVAQIVTGESSDPTVAKLRQDARRLLLSVPETFLGSIRDVETVKIGFTNITNEQWQTLLVEVKKELVASTDTQHRQQLNAVAATQEMTNEFRAIVEYYLIDYRKCQRLLANMLSAGKVKRNNRLTLRRRRSSQPASFLMNECHDAEMELLEERRARLETIANTDVTRTDMMTKTFLDAIERALNATSPSEVSVRDDIFQNDSGFLLWKQFVSNASLELKKEFYELVRDEFLILRHHEFQAAEWNDYDLFSVYKNFTHALYWSSDNESLKAALNVVIKAGEAFNLHYVTAEKRNSWDDSKIPVFGTLTYADEEPEKLGVRHMRHILNGYIRLYFRVLNILGPCQSIAEPPSEIDANEIPIRDRRFIKKRSVTADQIPDDEITRCYETSSDLLEERRARLEALAIENATGKLLPHENTFFKAIETVLNATSTSEIHFDEKWTQRRMILPTIMYLTSNASLELHKEGYAIIRDLFLELRKLNAQNPEWEGYNLESIRANLSTNMGFAMDTTAQSIFNDFMRIGEPFNLRYVELENRNSSDDANKPVFGNFVYAGVNPEIQAIRRMRHILDGFVKFYFKTQNPSALGTDNCGAESQAEAGETATPTREKRSVEKRFVTPNVMPEQIKTACWTKEQENVLLEERRARLEAFAKKNATGNMTNMYIRQYLAAVETALNATKLSEISFDDELMQSTPALKFIEHLVTNSSLELHKEGYEFTRDLYLEMLELTDDNPEWEGYNIDTIGDLIARRMIFNRVNMTSESIFNSFIEFGEIFNLRYDELENKNNGAESDKPVFGKFTYLGEDPEKLGSRRLRHMLDGFVRLYFKIQNPSTPGVCNLSVQPNAEHSADEIPKEDARTG